jgi:hypothetical protein
LAEPGRLVHGIFFVFLRPFKMFSSCMVPCVIFEDEHLLVVHKPAGWNTHAPSPFAGEGIYDWLRHRDRRWASLAIIHRLDKETSGVRCRQKHGRSKPPCCAWAINMPAGPAGNPPRPDSALF